MSTEVQRVSQEVTDLCEYTLLEGSIHEFVFRVGNRQAIDAWIIQVEAIVQATQADAFFQLIDTTRVKDVPASYAYQRIKSISARYTGVRHWRSAFVHNPSALLFLVNAYIKMLRRPIEARFFAPRERDAALEWLREGG